MAKKAGCVFTLVIAMLGEVGDKFVIGDTAGLREAIHTLLVDFQIKKAFVDEGFEIVLVDDGLWKNEFDGDHHVLGPFEIFVEIEVLNVHAHEEGVGG
jgi:hypothetical protein